MEGGYEVTQSRGIIRKNIEYIKKRRGIVNLICKGYQSGSTLIFDFDEQSVFIDKPKDWSPDNNKFRVAFRNEAMVWMHFVTTVQDITDDALQCALPQELFMLQRRSHYRVLLPTASRVTFTYNKEHYEFDVKDVSVGGMLIYSTMDTEIHQHGSHLKDVILSVPCHDKIPGAENGILTITVAEAEVMREFVRRQHPLLYCFGIRFCLSRPEEEKLLRYVRQRELEGLRKGLNG